jgi:hypothetical protein
MPFFPVRDGGGCRSAVNSAAKVQAVLDLRHSQARPLELRERVRLAQHKRGLLPPTSAGRPVSAISAVAQHWGVNAKTLWDWAAGANRDPEWFVVVAPTGRPDFYTSEDDDMAIAVKNQYRPASGTLTTTLLRRRCGS